MDTVDFCATMEELKLIGKITDRAIATWPQIIDEISLLMDLDAVHSNGTPIDLQKLLNADDFNLAHDIFGIMNNIDRRTGKLQNCFLPRCSQ